jgi:hypothetical protein
MPATTAYANEFEYMDNNMSSKRVVVEGTTVPMKSMSMSRWIVDRGDYAQMNFFD